MTSREIRQKFLQFFKDRGHAVVPSSSLIPDDPSVLLTTAGMQQFKPYLTGKANSVERFGSKTVFSIQKCFRTTDIDEVGDGSHLTFFEMLGNFSFGGYFKKEAIELSFEFLTSRDGCGLDPQKLFATAFNGDDQVPRDDEAIQIWQEQFDKAGINAKIGERIFLYGREKNWWESGLGPAGPDAEMFYDRGLPHDSGFGKTCHPNCDCGRFVEIGNDVFVQYNKNAEGKYEPLAQKSIDNGRGFERLVTILQGGSNVFETDLFAMLMALWSQEMPERTRRIIADHARGMTFLLADGVRPSNKEAGYVLRRLLRRVFVYAHMYRLRPDTLEQIIKIVIRSYGGFYPELVKNRDDIINSTWVEYERFEKTLSRGIKELEKLKRIDAVAAFTLYESYGLPYEVVKELGGARAAALKREDFDGEFKKHQEISRAGSEKKFGGHGLILNTGELKAGNEEELQKVLRLHTATHLLQRALREVLGSEVEQRGSDITSERTRFDFSFPRQMTREEIKKVEDLVNEKIKEDLPVGCQEMPKSEAEKSGALYFFREKYPDPVKVYFVGRDLQSAWSKEFCGGPHVKHTGEIGRFRIAKEEAVGAGIRRARGVLDG